MSDDETTEWDDSQQAPTPDPLGVIGWIIGGQYKIRSYLGGGGFGEVYDGYNVKLTEQRLVIKFFKRVQAREKFEKEAKILCLLDHPNISRVIDFLPEEGALVIAFIDGEDGGTILKQKGPLSDKMFIKVARSMTSALAYAHKRKIAHRDVKPDNIIIDSNNHVYLIDFGIAKVMREDATKTAYQALTPMFAAPERQAGDANYNPFLSDVYEIGVTLFNFATNEMPYRNPANPDINEWGGPAAKKLSHNLKRILMKATHPNPKKRYQSVAELSKEFQDFRDAYGGKSKKKLVIGVLAVAVIAVGIFLTKDIIRDNLLALNRVATETTQMRETKPPPTDPPEEAGILSDSTAQVIEKETTDTTGQVAVVETSKEEKQDNLTTKEELPEITEEKSEPEPEPEPPPLPTIQVKIIPEYNVTLLIDGIQRSQDKKHEIDPGRHEIMVIQPDYPMLVENIDVNVDRSLRYNLSDLFTVSDSIRFNIGLLPPDLGDAFLGVLFNGGEKKFSAEDVPIWDFGIIKGRWQIGFDLFNTTGGRFAGARIDSFVTFPYGGGPRIKVTNSPGVIDFGSALWKDIETIDMLVYWSK
jgi:serine/threonine protein kinase